MAEREKKRMGRRDALNDGEILALALRQIEAEGRVTASHPCFDAVGRARARKAGRRRAVGVALGRLVEAGALKRWRAGANAAFIYERP